MQDLYPPRSATFATSSTKDSILRQQEWEKMVLLVLTPDWTNAAWSVEDVRLLRGIGSSSWSECRRFLWRSL